MLRGNRKQNRRKNSQKRKSTERRLQLLETLEDRRLMAVAGGFDEQLGRIHSNRSEYSHSRSERVEVGQYRLNRSRLQQAAIANPPQQINQAATETKQSDNQESEVAEVTETTPQPEVVEENGVGDNPAVTSAQPIDPVVSQPVTTVSDKSNNGDMTPVTEIKPPPVIRYIDADRDGIPERKYVDRNHDGIPDSLYVDDDNDGMPEFEMHDKNNDRLWDYGYFDKNGDGVMDDYWLDRNGDGRPQHEEVSPIPKPKPLPPNDTMAFDSVPDAEAISLEKDPLGKSSQTEKQASVATTVSGHQEDDSRQTSSLVDNRTDGLGGDDEEKKPKIDNENPESTDDKPAVPKDDTPTRKDDDQQAKQNDEKQEQPKTLEQLQKEREELLKQKALLGKKFNEQLYDDQERIVSPEKQRALLDSPLMAELRKISKQLTDLDKTIQELEEENDTPAQTIEQIAESGVPLPAGLLFPEYLPGGEHYADPQGSDEARRECPSPGSILGFSSLGNCPQPATNNLGEDQANESAEQAAPAFPNTSQKKESKNSEEKGKAKKASSLVDDDPKGDNENAKNAGKQAEEGHSVTKQVGEEGTVTITSDRPISDALDKIQDEATRNFIVELLDSGEAASDSQPATEGVTLQVKITFTITDPETPETIRITIDIRATGKPSDLVDKILTVVEESQRDQVRSLLTQFLNLDQLAETGTPLDEMKTNILRFTCNQLICGGTVSLVIEDLFVGPLPPPTEPESGTPEEEPADSNKSKDSKSSQEKQQQRKTLREQRRSEKTYPASRDRRLRTGQNDQVPHSYQIKPVMEQVIDQVFATDDVCAELTGFNVNNFDIAAAIAGNQGLGNNQNQQESDVQIIIMQTVPGEEKPKGPPVPPCKSARELLEQRARRDGEAEHRDSNGWTWVFVYTPKEEKAANNRGNKNQGKQEKEPAKEDNQAEEKPHPENNQDKPAGTNHDPPVDAKAPGQKSPPAEHKDASGDPATDMIDDQDENGPGNANGQQEDQQTIKDSILGLGSDEWERRDDSTESLENSSTETIPYLIDALEKTDDPEVQWRLHLVLETLHQKLTDVHVCNNGYINVKSKLPLHMVKDAIITVWTKTPGQDFLTNQTGRAYEPITVSEDGSFTVRGNFNKTINRPAESVVIFVNGKEWVEVDPSETTHPGTDCDEHSVDLRREHHWQQRQQRGRRR